MSTVTFGSLSPDMIEDLRRQREDPRLRLGGAHNRSHHPATSIREVGLRRARRRWRMILRSTVNRMLVQ